MRLLKTKGYQLIEAKDIPEQFPEYAILSHTWISPKDEITYQDIKTRKPDIDNDVFKQRGWSKLRKYCDRAARDGWEWAWMDTCCIDKTSPADTQEAINAMFRWYQNAGVCYVYLEDVDAHRMAGGSPEIDDRLDLDTMASKDNVNNPGGLFRRAIAPFFVKAKWFTRGWTLQELLAPHYLVFLDHDWRRIGTRECWAAQIKEASKIEASYLTGFDPLDFGACSIAMRLSWASERKTTVEEDETYSLLGLFGISLPLIYGEGRHRAFHRLQRELITQYNDDSIFAWKSKHQSERSLLTGGSGPTLGVLAPSIREYWDASNMKAFRLYRGSFSMTNRGLEINTRRWRQKQNPNLCHIQLNCGVETNRCTVIYLNNIDDTYERISVNDLGDTADINIANWKEDLSKEPMLIRAGLYSGTSASSSILVLDAPDSVGIGAKYYVQIDSSNFGEPIQTLDDEMSGVRLASNELFLKPSRVIYINAGVKVDHKTFDFDIVINITSAGYPSAGLLSRSDPKWKRLGDPMTEARLKYEAHAEYLYFSGTGKQVLPGLIEQLGGELVLGAQLLPQPRKLARPLPRAAKLTDLRVYLLKIFVRTGSDSARVTENRKRRRSNS